MPKFDIHIQTLPGAEQQETFKFMSFGFESALGVKGFQMLINHWLKCLLTRRGTDPADLSYGTDLPLLIGSNIDLADARDVVVIAIDQCNEQLNANQRNDITLTPSERLASAQLLKFQEVPSDPGFSATIEIRNQSGERLQFNLPVYSPG